MLSHRFHFGLWVMLGGFVLQASSCVTGYEWIDRLVALSENQTYEEHLKFEQWVHDQALRDEARGLTPLPEWQGAFLSPAAPTEPPAQPTPPLVEAPPAAAPASHAPIILSVDYPSVIPPDGKLHYGWVNFTDAGADVSQIGLEVTWGTTPMQVCPRCGVEMEGPPAAGKVRIGFY